MGYNQTNMAYIRPKKQELDQKFSKNKPYMSE